MKDVSPAVFVAAMGDFRTPAVSGAWGGWNHSGEAGAPHDPGRFGAEGRGDIASVYYPAIGPYDMSDPDVAEYHCQLLKMAGVDGISFNLNFYEDWRVKSMKAYVAAMRRYGLVGMVRFEDKWHYGRYPGREEALRAVYADMDSWLKLLEPVQYRVRGRPVFMLFTFRMSPGELQAWRDRFPAKSRPFLVTLNADPPWTGIVEGTFGWCGLDPQFHQDRPPFVRYVDEDLVKKNQEAGDAQALDRLRRGTTSFHMAGVSPGFDDRGCWGWGGGPRKVERRDGKTYRYRWEKTLEAGWPVVLIPTWNDWMEGTVIEPSVEFGTKDLETTREFASRVKGVPAGEADLRLPVWIYRIRKSGEKGEALAAAEKASELIRTGQYAEAKALVHPWVEKLGLGVESVWNPPAP